MTGPAQIVDVRGDAAKCVAWAQNWVAGRPSNPSYPDLAAWIVSVEKRLQELTPEKSE